MKPFTNRLLPVQLRASNGMGPLEQTASSQTHVQKWRQNA